METEYSADFRRVTENPFGALPSSVFRKEDSARITLWPR